MTILDRKRAIEAAVIAEVTNSGLPDINDGAADAYRHLLLAAESRRQFGEASLPILQGREIGQKFFRKNTPAAAAMDRANNFVGSSIGERVDTWQEVIAEARAQMIAAARNNGSGQNGTATWNVKTPVTNWPTAWERRAPIRYQFGSKDHRFPKGPDQFMPEPEGMARNEVDPGPERRTTVAFQADDGGSKTGGMLGDSMLVDPKDLSFDNKDRVRARLGFHAEDAERDPKKREKVAKCMVDCFVREPGFEGLPGSLPKQLGGIAATMSPDTALAVLREAVPEVNQAELPRRRNQPRRRQTGPAPLDQAGRKAVQQAVLSQGTKPIQTGIAKGAAKKAVEAVGGKVMMGRELPGIFGAAFAPMGGAEKPMRAAAKTANAINQDAGIPDRADAKLTDRTSGRESATAIERAIQAAGPEKFVARLEDDPGFGFGGGGTGRVGRSLLNA